MTDDRVKPALAFGALFPILFTTLSCVTPPPDTGKADILATSAFYGFLSWGNKALFNNCWGMGLLKDAGIAKSTVSYDPATSTCDWSWSWPREAVSELKGYPTLFVGDKVYAPPGHDASTDPRFPLHLPLMQSLWVTGDFRVTGSGGFDFAFDMAFLEGSTSWPSAARAEIMIWLDASMECPADKEGDITIDGFAYDIFVNTDWNPVVPYLAFVLKGDAFPRRFPIHEFIRTGILKGYVPADAYLAAVELGPEIWWGRGEASVRDYTLSLNGH